MSPDFRIYRSLEEVGPEFAPSALTIGNFDGVHIGHVAIFRRVVALGREHNWKPSVLTFDPHPARIVAPERAPRLLSTPEQRCKWMKEGGIRQVVVVRFTREFSQLEPEQFVEEVVVKRLGARAVLVGGNFRFGRGHAGDTTLLKELGRRFGFLTEVLSAITVRQRLVSSSEIRRLIQAGDVSATGRLLGRAYWLEGEVVPGHGVGGKKTVPTLNLATSAEVLPARGVYITRTHDRESGRSWSSVTNVGFRPTFGGDKELSIETFLLEPLEGESPHLIRVEFLRRLREERKFPDPESLKAQILRDARRAHHYFARLDKWVQPGIYTRSDQ